MDALLYLTLKLFNYESIDKYSTHLAKFLNYYNYEKRLKSLKLKSLYNEILDRYQGKPQLFFENPIVDCLTLYT